MKTKNKYPFIEFEERAINNDDWYDAVMYLLRGKQSLRYLEKAGWKEEEEEQEKLLQEYDNGE